MKIKWSPLSIDRVTEIALYIANDKVGAADKWIDSIFSAVEKLSKFPQSGRIVPEFKKENITELIHGNYRIIYQVSQSEIEILTVRHGKQLFDDNDI
jgi:toxin ParE1/3/4